MLKKYVTRIVNSVVEEYVASKMASALYKLNPDGKYLLIVRDDALAKALHTELQGTLGLQQGGPSIAVVSADSVKLLEII